MIFESATCGKYLMSEKHADKIAVFLTVAFMGFMLFFGWQFHPLETHDSGEHDAYVAKAEQILHGQIPYDPYHPLFYPLLVAALSQICADAFVAARFISQFAASIFILITYLLGKRCYDHHTGLLALFLCATNFSLLQVGVQVATDMLFATLSLLILYRLCCLNRHTHYRSIVWIGFLFACAYFTRYTAIALLPIIFGGMIWIPDVDKKHIAVRLMVFITTAMIFLIPHFVLTYHVFGSPIYDEGWKSLTLKVYGGNDRTFLSQMPFDGLLSVLTYDPLTHIIHGLEQFGRYAFKGFGHLLTGDATVMEGGFRYMLESPHYALNGMLFIALWLLFSLSIYRQLFSLNRERVLIFAFYGIYLAMICLTFRQYPRLMLPVLPLSYIAIGHLLLFENTTANLVMRRFCLKNLALCVMLVICFQSVVMIKPFRHFVDQHPLSEVAMARELQERLGSDIRVLSTYRQMQRYVDYEVFFLRNAWSGEYKNSNTYYDFIQHMIRVTQADYLLIGKATFERGPESLLSNSNVPGFLMMFLQMDDVIVYRINRLNVLENLDLQSFSGNTNQI